MQCPLTGGRDRVRERGRERGKRGVREREGCRGISLIVHMLTAWSASLGWENHFECYKAVRCQTFLSAWILLLLNSHLTSGMVQWSVCLYLSSHQPGTSVQMWPVLTMRTWSHLHTCNVITWHDPIVGALWRFYFDFISHDKAQLFWSRNS